MEFPSYLEAVDRVLAIIIILCTCVGVPGNILALKYFVFGRKDLPTRIYIIMTLTDIAICFSTFPVAASYLYKRAPMVFGDYIFCVIWGVLWEILPYYSVFCVTVLSITRTVIVINPFLIINSTIVMIIMAIYLIYLAIIRILPLLLNLNYFRYKEKQCYCYSKEPINGNWFDTSETVLNSIQLAVPILPVIISCVISTSVIISSMNVMTNPSLSQQSSSRNVIKRKATITILIVTFVYVIFNVPVFINWVLNTADVLTNHTTTSPAMYYYRWNVTHVVCVALNAAINAIIYFFRMKRFRSSIGELFRKRRRSQITITVESEVRQCGPPMEMETAQTAAPSYMA